MPPLDSIPTSDWYCHQCRQLTVSNVQPSLADKDTAAWRSAPVVLSLFDGIGSTLVALQNLGVQPARYYSSEINADAIHVLKSHDRGGRIVHLGDVRGLRRDHVPEAQIDLLVGGSPCQNLSRLGQREGLSGSESSLFFEYVRIWKECQPRWWLFENVASMGPSDRAIITEALGVEPIMIDAAAISPGHRKRLYWTNIPFTRIPSRKFGLLLQEVVLDDAVAEMRKARCVTTNNSSPVIDDGRFNVLVGVSS